MTTQPTLTPAEWQRLTWHKRTLVVNELAKRERILRERVTALAAERNALEDAVETLRIGIRDELTTVDLRKHRPDLRIIWAADSQWSTDELKAAHAAWTRGDRDDWSVTGHRIYDRERRRNQRRAATDERRASNAANQRRYRAERKTA